MAGNQDAYESLKIHSETEKVEYSKFKSQLTSPDVKDPVYLDVNDDDDYLQPAPPDVYDSIDDGQVLDVHSHKNVPLPAVKGAEPQPASAPTPSNNSNKKRLAIIIGVVNSVVLVVIVVVVAVFLTRGEGPGSGGASSPPTVPFVGSFPSSTTSPSDIAITTSSSGLTTMSPDSTVSTATTSTFAPSPTTTLANLGTGSYNVNTCLNSTDCWVRYDFAHDDMYYPCLGERYVRYIESFQKYVGVRICEVGKRYHLFIAKVMTGFFENVGDSDGSGEDHCEFLGGNDDAINVAPLYEFIDMKGYHRAARGGSVQRGTLGRYRNARFVPWIECPGIQIPTNSYVVQADTAIYPPTSRECYLTAVPIEEPTISWRHSTEPLKYLGQERPAVFTYSCSTSRASNVEIHVLSISESSVERAYQSPDEVTIPFRVTVEPNNSLTQHPVVLVLAAYRTIEWQVSVKDVQIDKVVVINAPPGFPYTTLNISDSSGPINTPIDRISHYLGIGYRQPVDIKDYLYDNFGFITSFIGRYAPEGYGLWTGI